MTAGAVGPGAGRVVSVVAEIRSDEAEPRGGALAVKVFRQMARGRRQSVAAHGAERNHVGVALRRAVDHGMEPDERVVPRGVLVGRRGHLGRVRGAAGRMPAIRATAGVRGATVTRGRVAHVLLIGPPGRDMRRLVRGVLGVELRGDRRDGDGVDTSLTVDLSGVRGLVGVGRAGSNVCKSEPVVRTVRLRVQRWRLPGDLGDVVVQTGVAGCVVVLQQLPLAAERPVQVRGGRTGTEGGRIPLVLEIDDEDVADLPGRKGGTGDFRRRRRPGVRSEEGQEHPGGRQGQERAEAQGDGGRGRGHGG